MKHKKETIDVFISKYALTKGILEKKAIICDNTSTDMIEIVKEDKNFSIGVEYYHGEGKEWHRTKEDAINKSEEMRNKKIKNLESQIEKLKKVNFNN
ncbi:hypothetical protein [Clostridium botulinum]|uniref:hypothetical protein n=1 Tax=Clostridium botulinum TaxID=1491 RepID=UPI000472C706|nr:hypothetical protein [Clostridium botulinum]